MLSTNCTVYSERHVVENRAARKDVPAAADSDREECVTTLQLSCSRNGSPASEAATTGRCNNGNREITRRPAEIRCERDSCGGRRAEFQYEASTAVEEVGACRVLSAVEDNVSGTNRHHPARRRFVADGRPGDGTAATVVQHSAAVQPRGHRQRNNDGRRDGSGPVRKWLFTGYRHHYRGHRHHHHLHMWTSSCCWWLLVLYAAVVVVASFARAAHSAKDGK